MKQQFQFEINQLKTQSHRNETLFNQHINEQSRQNENFKVDIKQIQEQIQSFNKELYNRIQKNEETQSHMNQSIDKNQEKLIEILNKNEQRLQTEIDRVKNEYLIEQLKNINDKQLNQQVKMNKQYENYIDKLRNDNQNQIIKLENIDQHLCLLKISFKTTRNYLKQFFRKDIFNVFKCSCWIFYLDTKWKQNAITIAGANKQGNQLNQLDRPHGICIDDDQTIYIADCYNHRIMEWKSNVTDGRIVAGGNEKGNQTNQLDRPTNVIIDKRNNSLIISDNGNRRIMEWSLQNNTNNGQVIISDIRCDDLAMDKNGDIYVCDHEKHEVKRWNRREKEGTLVAGGNGKGNLLNQLNCPRYIFVDDHLSLYVSDRDNHRIMKWVKDAKEGIVVAGGNSLTELYHPYGLIIDQLGQIYVADCCNDRVMRWYEGDKQETVVVGGNGRGNEPNQLNRPMYLSFDQQGNLYVSDCWNHRIQKFEID